MKNEKVFRSGRQPVQPPILSLEDVVRDVHAVGNIADEGGADVLAHVVGNTVASGTFLRKLTAYRAYGVLEYRTQKPETYALTEIGRTIAHASSQEEEHTAIARAFLGNLYMGRVWENYKGRLLRNDSYLVNFFGTIGIPKDFQQEWATYFVDNAKFSGLLQEREPGVYYVTAIPSAKQTEVPPATGKREEEPKGDIVEPPIPQGLRGSRDGGKPTKPNIPENVEWGCKFTPVLSTGESAIIAIPNKLNRKDAERLKTLLTSAISSLAGFMAEGEDEPT